MAVIASISNQIMSQGVSVTSGQAEKQVLPAGQVDFMAFFKRTQEIGVKDTEPVDARAAAPERKIILIKCVRKEVAESPILDDVAVITGIVVPSFRSGCFINNEHLLLIIISARKCFDRDSNKCGVLK